MNIVLFSSPHKCGNTAKLVEEYVGESSDTVVFNLYELSPQPCIDCGVCRVENDCSLHDLDYLMHCFENADRIIFAFPVYNLSFPAPMKALFDRFQRYYNARFIRNEKPPIKKRRRAVVLITCGRERSANEDIIILQLKQAFSILNLEVEEIVFRDKTDCEKGDRQ